MPIDRRIAPTIHPIDALPFPTLDHFYLDNGIKVTEINKSSQDILQVEIINSAGRLMERVPMASRVTAALLKEGARGMTGQHIAERVDYYGGSLSTNANLDVSRANIFTLSQYQEEVIPYLSAVWWQPDFAVEELEKYKRNRIQKLREDLAKSDTVSYRAVTELIYGSDHPYGYNSTEDMYRALTIEHIGDHYLHAFGHNTAEMVLTGKISDKTRTLINQHFGQDNKAVTSRQYVPPSFNHGNEKVFISVGKDYQSSIKIGKRLFTRDHEDYPAMFITNVIFGGYFGSRLMRSIREEKGYTYNIYSSIGTFRHDGFFYISTEVDHNMVQPTLEEIYQQLHLLRTRLVDEIELEMVKNYILGHFLSMLDGPFNISQMVKTFIIHQLDASHLNRMREKITHITAEEIRQMAHQYLDPTTMIEVIAGK